MDEELILQLVKGALGIRTAFKDSTLKMRIEGVMEELKNEMGIVLDSTSPSHLEFVVDYVAWRYENWGSDKDMPRHLKFRRNNLFIHNGGGTNE